ncbi:MAG: CRISPR-associated helicase/endonuclease Cas3, partial [bacterium]
MSDQTGRTLYRYWGKASSSDERGTSYHLLAYHCLDVAAVGAAWWKASEVIRSRFITRSGLGEPQVKAWVLFFLTLHDLGKFDVRFQLKAKDVALTLWDGFANADPNLPSGYYHGEYSCFWLYDDLSERFDWKPGDAFWEAAAGEEIWDKWLPWVQAVAGHHGVLPLDLEGTSGNFADQTVIDHDKEARLAFVSEMENLFLKPAGLSLDDLPPPCNIDFLAGFCAVCDWLGSAVANSAGQPRFTYIGKPGIPLFRYFDDRLNIAEQILAESGSVQQTTSKGGMQCLFPDKTPRQVQKLVDDLPLRKGLTLIEAPTGSGKTEAALAYASRLMTQGIAESIIFALPTQATANAMLTRLIEVSEKLYAQTNLVLAHGKARFQEVFIDLKKASQNTQPQDANFETEASVQYSQWLSQSRKRVFLGQIGVCTVDQVLISALPVKHKFVRSFGLGKSVLIVDEVHAYDSYMYGLLEEVLKRQRAMGGSAVLLSATLPLHQRKSLIFAWDGNCKSLSQKNPYPLITQVTNVAPGFFALSKKEQDALERHPKRVNVRCRSSKKMQPDEALLNEMIQAAEAGANVVFICNLVADAQKTASHLREMSNLSVDLFHSRFRFKDRQVKETKVLSAYGKGGQRKRGGILVATQVVEQSLDLDFDWMLTQLCPMDLFFQRLGRLHRHARERPKSFNSAKCTVIIPKENDYKLHAMIYGMKDAPNTRVLWRTERLLTERNETVLSFPQAYRSMIERVYAEDPWDDEPDEIQKAHEKFEMHMEVTRMN